MEDDREMRPEEAMVVDREDREQSGFRISPEEEHKKGISDLGT